MVNFCMQILSSSVLGIENGLSEVEWGDWIVAWQQRGWSNFFLSQEDFLCDLFFIFCLFVFPLAQSIRNNQD